MFRLFVSLVILSIALPATAVAQAADAAVPDAGAPDVTPRPPTARRWKRCPRPRPGPRRRRPRPRPPCTAPQPPPSETVVTAPRPLTAASSHVVRDRDFLLRPAPAPARHPAGRARDVRHRSTRAAARPTSTSCAASTPITAPTWRSSSTASPSTAVSHGHGQGYADLNFVIPELVERVEVARAPTSRPTATSPPPARSISSRGPGSTAPR